MVRELDAAHLLRLQELLGLPHDVAGLTVAAAPDHRGGADHQPRAGKQAQVLVSIAGGDLLPHARHLVHTFADLDTVRLIGAPDAGSRSSVVARRLRLAATCDLLTAFVGRQYGWVPTPQEGGDGVRNLLWLEIDAARAANRPVFVLAAGAQDDWPYGTETAAIERAAALPTDEAIRIAREAIERMKRLDELRSYLQEHFAVEDLTTPESAAAGVWRQLAKQGIITDQQQTPVIQLSMAHTFMPATNLLGRDDVLSGLLGWLRRGRQPAVLAVVGDAGSGKTALVAELIKTLRADDVLPAQIVAWSFYADPNVNRFMRHLGYVVTEQAPDSGPVRDVVGAADTNWTWEEVLRNRHSATPLVVILDGMEHILARTQVRPSDRRNITAFLTAVADGRASNTRALLLATTEARERISRLGAEPVELGRLATPHCSDIVRLEAGAAASAAAVAHAARACAGLPLLAQLLGLAMREAGEAALDQLIEPGTSVSSLDRVVRFLLERLDPGARRLMHRVCGEGVHVSMRFLTGHVTRSLTDDERLTYVNQLLGVPAGRAQQHRAGGRGRPDPGQPGPGRLRGPAGTRRAAGPRRIDRATRPDPPEPGPVGPLGDPPVGHRHIGTARSGRPVRRNPRQRHRGTMAETLGGTRHVPHTEPDRATARPRSSARRRARHSWRWTFLLTRPVRACTSATRWGTSAPTSCRGTSG